MAQSQTFVWTWELLTSQPATFADLSHRLAKLCRSDVLVGVASFSELINRDAFSSASVQTRMTSAMLEDDLARKMKEKIDAGLEGHVFFRRQLWFLFQLALLVCKEDTPRLDGQALKRAIVACCIMANDLVKKVGSVQLSEPPPDELRSKWLATFLITNVDFSFGQETIPRADLLWNALPAEEDVRKKAAELEIPGGFAAIFKEAYDIELDEFLLFLVYSYFKFWESSNEEYPKPAVIHSELVYRRMFAQGDVDKAMERIASDPEQLASDLLGNPRQSWTTDFTPLMRSPLVRVDYHRYICPDLHLLRSYFVHGIYELLILTDYGPKVRQLFGFVFEKYVARMFDSFANPSPLLAKVFFSSVKFAADTTQQVCDGLLAWQSTAVLMEVKAFLLTSRQKFANRPDETMKAIDDQLAKMDGKDRKGVGQLAHSLARILRGEEIFSGQSTIDLLSFSKLHPAIVVFDESVANHAVREYLNAKLRERLQADGVDLGRVGCLLLFSIREIEVFEQLALIVGAERLLREFADYITRHPDDHDGIFRTFAADRYASMLSQPSAIFERLEAVKRRTVEELTRRKTEWIKSHPEDSSESL